MPDATFLTWPFFDDTHRTFASTFGEWARQTIPSIVKPAEEPHQTQTVDRTCKALIRRLGDDGWLRYVVPKAYGGITEKLDARTICIARETLASHSGLAEFMFAMQGLGTGPITLFGSDALKQRYLPNITTGNAIAAFAISESDAGSDIAAMQTTARRTSNGYIINGEKTWISNAGLANHYIVFCRLEDSDTQNDTRTRYIAFVVDADTPGLTISQRIDVIAPHPLGTLTFNDCYVTADAVIGAPGDGLKIALGTLDLFRPTVGAAALGFARRALDETLAHVQARQAFGQALSDFQLTRARIASMATDIDTSALLIYRAAWTRDTSTARITREAAMAKWYATEAAQRVIDSAVQLLGGRGVVAGAVTEHLYREIRALRIYEGTSEIQQLIIAGQVLAAAKPSTPMGEQNA